MPASQAQDVANEIGDLKDAEFGKRHDFEGMRLSEKRF